MRFYQACQLRSMWLQESSICVSKRGCGQQVSTQVHCLYTELYQLDQHLISLTACSPKQLDSPGWKLLLTALQQPSRPLWPPELGRNSERRWRPHPNWESHTGPLAAMSTPPKVSSQMHAHSLSACQVWARLMVISIYSVVL